MYIQLVDRMMRLKKGFSLVRLYAFKLRRLEALMRLKNTIRVLGTRIRFAIIPHILAGWFSKFAPLKDLLDNVFDYDQKTKPDRLLHDVPRKVEFDSRSTYVRVDFFGGMLAGVQLYRVKFFLQIVGLRRFSVFSVVFGALPSVQFLAAFGAACLLAIGMPNVGRKPPFADFAASFPRFGPWHRRTSIG
jgi:hypothetical protein